jgi:hypothetical protein
MFWSHPINYMTRPQIKSFNLLASRKKLKIAIHAGDTHYAINGAEWDRNT